MFRNYLAAALRNLARNRFYAAIGIVVLAVGLCAAMLMALYIRAQWNHDRFIPAYERTYLSVTVEALAGQAPVYDPKGPSWLAGFLKQKFSEIEAITRITAQELRLRQGQVEAKEKIYWADRNVFDVLSLPVLVGDLRSALNRPDGIVLTRSVARKYFGHDDVIGQSIELDRAHVMVVTAVIEDFPINGTQLESVIFVSGLASHSPLTQRDNDPRAAPGHGLSWDVRTYFRLAPNVSIERLQNVMRASFQENLGPLPMPGLHTFPQFIRFDRVHVFPGLHPGKTENFSMSAALGLLILLVASTVFVNLATARSAQRAPEVGVRKAHGARRSDLFIQFVGEALIQVLLAAAMAIALVELLLPMLSAFTETEVEFDYWRHPSLIIWFVAGALLTGIIVGAYPALVLTSFRSADVLRRAATTSGGDKARHVLVTLQFAALIALVVVVSVIYRQYVYATREALRVDTNQVLIVRSPCNPTIKDELRALAGVRAAFCSRATFLEGISFTNVKLKDGGQRAIRQIAVEPGIFGLYGLKPAAGKFSTVDAGDSTSPATRQYVMNESAISLLGFSSPTAAVGQIVSLRVGDGTDDSGEIIGVVPDFLLGSVEQKIEPSIYLVTGDHSDHSLIHIKLSGQSLPETLAAIDKLWRKSGTAEPIQRFFIDDYIQNIYRSVQRQAWIILLFSWVAVLLACTGLIGLVASIAQRRTKEIGVRKTMGARTGDVMRLLLWQFAQPVLWANLIAWPVAGFLMHRWLQSFAYRIDLEPWLFVASSVAALLIALLTVGAHCYLVARAKPVAALRYE